MSEHNQDVSEVPEALSVSDRPYSGWAEFAGVMMFGISWFALLAAIIGLFNNNFIYDNSALGTAWNWIWFGLFDLITAIVAAYAGYAILQGQRIGFWLGLIFATLSAGRWFLFIQGLPLWSLAMVTIWILVAFGLIRDRAYFEK
jgi:hypothetical protein